jgi:hypothetical protein
MGFRNLKPLPLTFDRHARVVNMDDPPFTVVLMVDLGLTTMSGQWAAVLPKLGLKIPIEFRQGNITISVNNRVLNKSFRSEKLFPMVCP